MTGAPQLAPAALGVLLFAANGLLADLSPPVVLLSDRDAMAAVLPGAVQFPDAPVKLSSEDKQRLEKEWNFKVHEGAYRLYEGRDGAGRVVGTVVFLTQATIHSPVRIAVGVGKEGKVAGAAVVEVSQETFPWVKPLIQQGILKRYVGQGARGEFKVPEQTADNPQRTMEQFYAKVITRMVQWGAAICETTRLE